MTKSCNQVKKSDKLVEKVTKSHKLVKNESQSTKKSCKKVTNYCNKDTKM